MQSEEPSASKQRSVYIVLRILYSLCEYLNDLNSYNEHQYVGLDLSH